MDEFCNQCLHCEEFTWYSLQHIDSMYLMHPLQISLNGIEILSLLIDRMDDHFKPHVTTGETSVLCWLMSTWVEGLLYLSKPEPSCYWCLISGRVGSIPTGVSFNCKINYPSCWKAGFINRNVWYPAGSYDWFISFHPSFSHLAIDQSAVGAEF